MPWGDLGSSSGKNLYTLKCHPGQHGHSYGELLVRMACKRHGSPRDHVDPNGFGFHTGHGAETVRQPPGVTACCKRSRLGDARQWWRL